MSVTSAQGTTEPQSSSLALPTTRQILVSVDEIAVSVVPD